MVVNAKFLNALCACIHQAEKVRLAAGKLELGDPSIVRTFVGSGRVRAVKIHLSVDEVVIRRRSESSRVSAHHALKDGKVRGMKVIVKGDRSQVDVVIGAFGAVYHYGTP